MSGKHVNRMDALVLGGSLVLSSLAFGCRQTPPVPPVQKTDSTTMNPNGPVPPPAQNGNLAVRNPDGSVTNPDGSVTYPPGSRTALRENGMNPVPAGPVLNRRPSSTPNLGPLPDAAPVHLSVPSGTPVVVRINSGLAASRNQVGDRFTGVLDAPIQSRGVTLFASGTPVSGEVVAAQGKGRFKGAGDLGIELTAIGRERVTTTEYEKVSPGRGKRTAGFAGGGAGLGAIIGGLAGGGKGALIGGLAGAGAGTAAGAYTGNRDVVIPSESRITFRLTESLTR